MADKRRITIECGPIDASYKGVLNPRLTAVYLQTPEEAARYTPIMEELAKNGLPNAGGQISGI